MGSWNEVAALPEELRLSYYYHCCKSAGLSIDWSTGRAWRPE